MEIILANFVKEGPGSIAHFFWAGICPRCETPFKIEIPREQIGPNSGVPIKRAFRQIRRCEKCYSSFSISIKSNLGEFFDDEDRAFWLGKNG